MSRTVGAKETRRWNSETQRWEYAVVHHINGDPTNNDLDNLALVWPSDNPRRKPPQGRS